MSEPGDVLRLTLSGLLGTCLLAGELPGARDAYAAGLQRMVLPLAANGTIQAQAQDRDARAAADGEGNLAESDPPFSELNEALSTARSKLAELTKAAEIAKVAGELREKLQAAEAENRQLRSALDQIQSENSELKSEQQAAAGQIDALGKSSEEAVSEARRLDEELVAMRWQNNQLSTSLVRAETAARESTEELTKVRTELDSRAEALAATAEESASEISRLQRELDAAREETLLADQRQAELDTELVELRRATEESTTDSTRLAQDLDSTITELANARTELVATREAFDEAKIALEAANGEADLLREQVASNRSEAEKLRRRLKTAEADIEKYKSVNTGLEQQVSLLREAAGEATDAARLNLLAVEDQINEINAALASVKGEDFLPAGGPAEAEAPPVAASKRADDTWVPRPSPARSTAQRQLIAAASEDRLDQPAASSPLANRVGQRSLGSAENGSAIGRGEDVAALVADLPPDRRQTAEALLRGFNARRGERGLSMTVPGAVLFAVDSEQIEPSAHDALANVADLVNLYEDRDVLIVGHTDAVGDADYNQQLSERRAALVKAFFVENFQIDADRVDIEGMGEQKPITSNATLNGRKANRRVEVMILN